MNYSQSDIDSLAAKLEAMSEGEREALAAALLPDDEVVGFAADSLGHIRGLLKWNSLMSGPIASGDLGSGRVVSGPIPGTDGGGEFKPSKDLSL